MKIRHFRALLLPALLLGCGTADDMPTQPNWDGAAQLSGFQHYAALGNSLTAGYQSGAWGNPDHVAHSFPAQIARQLGIEGFDQVSLTATGLGFSGGLPVGNMTVDFAANGSPVLGYSTAAEANLAALAAGAGAGFDYAAPRNFGIPGIALLHAVNVPLGTYAAGNPYANFYIDGATTAAKTQLQLAAESGADFCTMWLGNNDVLGYVTSGGTGSITDGAVFAGSYAAALAALSNVAHLVAINIPAVTDIPFVTYFNPVLVEMLAGMGYDPVVMVTDDDLGSAVPVMLTPGSGNYVLLPAASAMAADPTLGSPMNPLPDALVLDAAEAAAALDAVTAFNATIAAAVDAANDGRTGAPVLLVDMNAFFGELAANGYETQGETFTAEMVSGGMFSLDGVHPGNIGYAIVANRIIEEMNAGWDLNVAPVDLSTIYGVTPGFAAPVDPAQLPDFSTVVELFR